MPLGNESLQVAIAGAASLRGKDLKEWMDESGFPAGEIRLLDEEYAAGTLTEVGGTPAVVQLVDESSFERMRFVFFAGSASFAVQHGSAAESAGATVIDMTGGLAARPEARPWIPRLDALLSPPVSAAARIHLCVAPSAPAIVASSLAVALHEFSCTRLALIFFEPASERGRAGVAELEAQTSKLLSLQPMPQEVFDTQVAFNLTDRWGAASGERLSDVRAAFTREVRDYLRGRVPVPAMTLVQAPVFFGHAFSAYAEFAAPPDFGALTSLLGTADFHVATPDDLPPSNISVAGEAQAFLSPPEPDASVPNGFWFWGAADNLRLASANALRIAERLLVS